MSLVNEIIEKVKQRDPREPEFHQAVTAWSHQNQDEVTDGSPLQGNTP